MATALFLLVQLVRSKVDWILTACVFVISFLVARIAFSMQRRASLPPALLNPEKEIYKNVDNAFAQLNPPCRVGIERLASVPAMGETELFEYLKNRGFGIPVEEIMEKIKGSALVENAGGLLEIKAAKLKMVTLWLQKHRPQ